MNPENHFIFYEESLDEATWSARVVGSNIRIEAPTLNDARSEIERILRADGDLPDTIGHVLSTRRVAVEAVTLGASWGADGRRTPLFTPVDIEIRTPYVVGGTPRLLPSLVMFVDELGTKAASADASDTYVREKEMLLRRARQDLSPKTDNESVLAFTDHVVVGVPLGTDPIDHGSLLGGLLASMAFYQYELLIRGQALLRGGVASGEYYASNSFAHGPALIDAVQIEEEIAEFPRIVLSDACVQLVTLDLRYYGNPPYQEDVPWLSALLIDADGQVFLDYLTSVHGDVVSTEGGDGIDLLGQHRDIVASRLDSAPNTRRIRTKLRWLCDYHNAVCRRLLPTESSLLVEYEAPIAAARIFRTLNQDVL